MAGGFMDPANGGHVRMKDIEDYIQSLVVELHQRQGGGEGQPELDFQSHLNDERWRVDSMDLAEIVARIHRDFGVLVFEQASTPVYWADIVRIITDHRAQS